MKRFSSLALSGLVASMAVGCGGEISEGDAAKGWEATNKVLSSGNSMASASGNGPEDSFAGLDYSFDYTCPEGGSAEFTGKITLESIYGEFDWDVAYNNCGSDGVIIDGTLDFSLDTRSTETEYSLTYTYTGELVYSGDVDGVCVIDMVGGTAVNTTETSISYDVAYKGSICGHDASEALSGTVAAY